MNTQTNKGINNMSKVKTLTDGFQWLVLTIDEAQDIFNNPNNTIEIYALNCHDYEQEALVTDNSYFNKYDTFGIEIGFKETK